MEKIYIVTSGSYSDYHIVAVFSEKEKADLYLDKMLSGRYDDEDVEEWGVDVEEVPELLRHNYIYEVAMDRQGNLIKIEFASGDQLESAQKKNWYISRDIFTKVNNGEPYFRTCVLAKDKSHAIKIAGERRAVIIAMNLWYDPISFAEMGARECTEKEEQIRKDMELAKKEFKE